MKLTLWAVLGLTLLVAACDKSSTEPTEVVAAPTMTEPFTGTIAVGGSSFYSFVIGQRGTVNITLKSVTGANVDPSVAVGLSIGFPTGTTCSALAGGDAQAAQAGSSPQVTGTYGPGTFCARIYDAGNLVAPAAFDISIAHP